MHQLTKKRQTKSCKQSSLRNRETITIQMIAQHHRIETAIDFKKRFLDKRYQQQQKLIDRNSSICRSDKKIQTVSGKLEKIKKN